MGGALGLGGGVEHSRQPPHPQKEAHFFAQVEGLLSHHAWQGDAGGGLMGAGEG